MLENYINRKALYIAFSPFKAHRIRPRRCLIEFIHIARLQVPPIYNPLRSKIGMVVMGARCVINRKTEVM